MVQCQNFGVLSKLIASAKVFFGDKNKQTPNQHPPSPPPKPKPDKNAVCGGDPRETLLEENSPQ